MTPDQIEAVKTSFAQVVPIADAAAALFYRRLFETTPEVRPLFRGDMSEQGRKLMATLGVVVAHLHDIDAVMPAVRALAIRHVSYGVAAAHYQAVGAALLWTLETGLGAAFTPAAKQAWIKAYETVSLAMIAEAYPSFDVSAKLARAPA